MNEHTPIEPAAAPETPSKRKAARDSMFLSVEIERVADGERFAARARNVSKGGLMADGHDQLRVGDHVAVTMRGYERIAGEVAWIRNGGVGISFDQPIDPRRTRKPVAGPKPEAAPAGALFPRIIG